MKISKLTKITGALNHTYPELSVARATLVQLKRKTIVPETYSDLEINAYKTLLTGV